MLYHYTCDHGADGIRREGVIRPNRHVILGVGVVWLTDLDVPYREALGLTSHILSCDRTAHRLEVVCPWAVWWPRYARGLPSSARWAVESAAGMAPVHWWVATEPVAVARAA